MSLQGWQEALHLQATATKENQTLEYTTFSPLHPTSSHPAPTHLAHHNTPLVTAPEGWTGAMETDTPKRRARVWTSTQPCLACEWWLLRQRQTACAPKLSKMHAVTMSGCSLSHTHTSKQIHRSDTRTHPTPLNLLRCTASSFLLEITQPCRSQQPSTTCQPASQLTQALTAASPSP